VLRQYRLPRNWERKSAKLFRFIVKLPVKKPLVRPAARNFCEKPPKKKTRINRALPGNTFPTNFFRR